MDFRNQRRTWKIIERGAETAHTRRQTTKSTQTEPAGLTMEPEPESQADTRRSNTTYRVKVRGPPASFNSTFAIPYSESEPSHGRPSGPAGQCRYPVWSARRGALCADWRLLLRSHADWSLESEVNHRKSAETDARGKQEELSKVPPGGPAPEQGT